MKIIFQGSKDPKSNGMPQGIFVIEIKLDGVRMLPEDEKNVCLGFVSFYVCVYIFIHIIYIYISQPKKHVSTMNCPKKSGRSSPTLPERSHQFLHQKDVRLVGEIPPGHASRNPEDPRRFGSIATCCNEKKGP